MSQYYLALNNDNILLYGFDAPTGGFFYSECDKDDEELFSEDGLTLTELISKCKNYKIEIPKNRMIKDFYMSDNPSELQKKIALMFNKNLDNMLDKVREDIEEKKWTNN